MAERSHRRRPGTSPNLAAQAGAIDETRVAMAQQGADPQGSRNLQMFEFRVSTVRALSGSCTRKP